MLAWLNVFSFTLVCLEEADTQWLRHLTFSLQWISVVTDLTSPWGAPLNKSGSLGMRKTGVWMPGQAQAHPADRAHSYLGGRRHTAGRTTWQVWLMGSYPEQPGHGGGKRPKGAQRQMPRHCLGCRALAAIPPGLVRWGNSSLRTA